jgi:hypothetical protein
MSETEIPTGPEPTFETVADAAPVVDTSSVVRGVQSPPALLRDPKDGEIETDVETRDGG